MPRPASAALNVSQMILRILIIGNYLIAAIIVGILISLFVDPGWTLKALGFRPPVDPQPMIWGLRLIALLGLAGAPLNLVVFGKSLAIVNRVSEGDPFVAENAVRLHAIAWALLCEQLLQLTMGAVIRSSPELARSLHFGGVSLGGLLTVFLMFVLANVFAEGARMRADLEGTV